MKNNTLYFKRKNNKKTLIQELTNIIDFDYKFNLKKNTYLENDKYLIVIAKHYIRVLVFSKDDYSISYIQDTINNLNINKR